MYRILLFVLLAAFVTGCSNSSEKKADKNKAETIANPRLQTISWMLGDWYIDYPEGILTETWKVASDTEWTGVSRFIDKKGDTMMTEHIRLAVEDSTIWYIPTVTNQNGGLPVRFKEANISNDMAGFENPAHDFPQRIIYQKLSASEMDVRIEGIDKGKSAQETFHYKKKEVSNEEIPQNSSKKD